MERRRKERGVKKTGQGIFTGLNYGPSIGVAMTAERGQNLRFEAMAQLGLLLKQGTLSSAEAETQVFLRFRKDFSDNLELSILLRNFSQQYSKEDNYRCNYLPAF